MKHRRSISFKEYFAKLPTSIQEEAKARFHLLQENPAHPQLHFKEFRSTGGGIHNDGTFSVRVNANYRALGTEVTKGVIVWWFIGDHHAYMKLAEKSYKPKPKKLRESTWPNGSSKKMALEVQQALVDIGCDTHAIKRKTTIGSMAGDIDILGIDGYSVYFVTKTGNEMMVHVPDDADMELCIYAKSSRKQITPKNGGGYNDTLTDDGYDCTDDASFASAAALANAIDERYN